MVDEKLNLEKIQKLRSVIGKVRQVNVKKAMEDLKAGKALTSAQIKVLEEFDVELQEAQETAGIPADPQGPETFKNLRDVLLYLKEQGYKVSQSNLYKHRQDSKIRPAADGLFSLKTVKAYAATWLKTTSTYKTEKDEQLQQRKLKADIQRTEIKVKQEQIKLGALNRIYILRGR